MVIQYDTIIRDEHMLILDIRTGDSTKSSVHTVLSG